MRRIAALTARLSCGLLPGLMLVGAAWAQEMLPPVLPVEPKPAAEGPDVSTRAVVSPAVPGMPAERSAFAKHPDQARIASLVSEGQADAAYAALLPLEAEYAGDVSFDYLFGVACLDSGRPSRAVFSLQSVVATDRGFAGARLELARAYFKAADYADARQEFGILATLNPPPETAEVIAGYLKALESQQRVDQRVLRFSIEAAAGLDTNANGGTDAQTFLGIPLNDTSVATESPFYGLGLRAAHTRLMSPRLRWQSVALLRHREYPDASFVSTSLAQLSTGLAYASGQQQVSLDVSGRQTLLDGEDNQTLLAADLAGEIPLVPSVSVAASLRLGQISYPDEISVQDVSQVLGGVSLRWRPASADNRLELFAGPVLGVETADQSDSSYGRDLSGARAGLTVLRRGMVWRASVALLKSEFDGPFLGGEREDDQAVAQLELELPGLIGGWLLRPSLIYVDNSSSLTLYEYDRLEAGLALVHTF